MAAIGETVHVACQERQEWWRRWARCGVRCPATCAISPFGGLPEEPASARSSAWRLDASGRRHGQISCCATPVRRQSRLERWWPSRSFGGFFARGWRERSLLTTYGTVVGRADWVRRTWEWPTLHDGRDGLNAGSN